MARLTELNKQIKELQEKIDSYEYDPYNFEEDYREFLNEGGKVIIAGITFYPSDILEMDPIAYKEGLLNYADAVYEESQDKDLNDLKMILKQLLEELKEKMKEIIRRSYEKLN